MRRIRCAIVLASLLALTACGPAPRRAEKSPMQQRIEKMFNAADADRDEWLTPSELEAGFPWLAGKFAEIDSDHNGKVSLAELTSYIELSRMLPEAKKK
jgi:Ca2+-binding EF-hand superfamily protein